MGKLIFLSLAVLTALLVIAVKTLPWWGVILLFGALFLGVRFGFGYVVKQLFMLPFKAKGKTLAGASVTIHGIKNAGLPNREKDAEEAEYYQQQKAEDKQMKWYYLDMTITPQTNGSKFTHWEPGELMFVSMEAQAADLGEDEQMGDLHDYRIFVDGSFRENDRGKLKGKQRVKFHLGLPPTLKEVQLRYYFELFGRISLP